MSEELFVCPGCDGDGEMATSHRFTCYYCKGKGKLDKEAFESADRQETAVAKRLSRDVSAAEYRQMGG